MAVWLDSTYHGASEPAQKPPEAFCATAVLKCPSAEACLAMLKRLREGVDVLMDENDEESQATLDVLVLRNTFAQESQHPTHLRNASLHMLLCHRGTCVAVMVQVEHTELLSYYQDVGYEALTPALPITPCTHPSYHPSHPCLLYTSDAADICSV